MRNREKYYYESIMIETTGRTGGGVLFYSRVEIMWWGGQVDKLQ